jgi:hypothetical protein
MSLPPIRTFPLPDHPPEFDQLVAGLQTNGAILDSAIGKVANSIYTGLSKNASSQNRVINKVVRTVQAGLVDSGATLGPVVQQAATSVNVGLQNQGQLLDVVAGKGAMGAALPIPVGQPLPPGQPDGTFYIGCVQGQNLVFGDLGAVSQPGIQFVSGPWNSVDIPGALASAPVCIGGATPQPPSPPPPTIPPPTPPPAPTGPPGPPLMIQGGPAPGSWPQCGTDPAGSWVVVGGCPVDPLTGALVGSGSPQTISYAQYQALLASNPGMTLLGRYTTQQIADYYLSTQGGAQDDCTTGPATGATCPPPPPPGTPGTTPPAQPTCPVRPPEDPCATPFELPAPVLPPIGDACGPLFASLGVGKDALGPAVAFIQQLLVPSSVQAVRDWAEQGGSFLGYTLKDVVQPFINGWSQIGTWAIEFLKSGKGCTSPTAINAVILLAGYSVLNKWVGIDLKDGKTQAEYLLNSQCPTYIPSQGEIDDLWMHGWITVDDWACYTGALNNLPEFRKKVIADKRPFISADEVATLEARGMMPVWPEWMVPAGNTAWDRIGYYGSTLQQTVRTLRRWYPSTEQVMSAVDDGLFGANYMVRWGLDTSFANGNDPQAEAWLAGNFVDPADALTVYALGWQQPSAGRAKEWLYRLRADAPGVTSPFVMQDYLDVVNLGERSDVVIAWESQVAYRPMSISEVGDLYARGAVDGERLTGAYLDAGYSPADASQLSAVHGQQVTRQRSAETQGWTLSRVAEMMRAGLTDQAGAEQLLQGQGYTSVEITQAGQVATEEYKRALSDRAIQRTRARVAASATAAYTVGTASQSDAQSALQSAGYPPAAAQALTSAIDATVQAAAAKAVLGAMKGAFLRGALSPSQLQGSLSIAGIDPGRAAGYLSEWTMMRYGKHPARTIGDIRKWVQGGLLDIATARQWLINLGYTDPDLILHVQAMEQAVATAATKLETAADKSAAARTKATNAALAAARKVQAQAIAALKKEQPLSILKKGVQTGVIDSAYVRERLTAYGYSEGSQNLLLAEWLKIDLATAEGTGFGVPTQVT